MYCIYMHTIINNNKKYIGQSKTDPSKRWGLNGHRYKGQLFYNAIQKYGWDNIKHEILIDNLTKEDADYYEQYYITLYKTNNNLYGYNVAPGGCGNPGLAGKLNPNARSVICIETGQEWECANYCAQDLGVNCASLQESLYNGYKCKGLHYKYKNDNLYKVNKEPYGVICETTGQIWNTVKECAKDLGVHPRSIARYCTNSRKPINGYVYKYCIM